MLSLLPVNVQHEVLNVDNSHENIARESKKTKRNPKVVICANVTSCEHPTGRDLSGPSGMMVSVRSRHLVEGGGKNVFFFLRLGYSSLLTPLELQSRRGGGST